MSHWVVIESESALPVPTQMVRIEFLCGNTPSNIKKIDFYHALPTSLIKTSRLGYLLQDPLWKAHCWSLTNPIITEHAFYIYTQIPTVCFHCSNPTEQALLFSLPRLHYREDPHVTVISYPCCWTEECDELNVEVVDVATRMADAMEQVNTAKQAVNEDGRVRCQVCEQTRGLRRCGRCGKVEYCGREHQRMDWKFHRLWCEARVVEVSDSDSEGTLEDDSEEILEGGEEETLEDDVKEEN